ncbi:MAG: lipoprotein signal peptidase [Flavobacteriales bacterium]
MKRPLLTIAAILLLDQVSKFLVKLNMCLNESFEVLGDFFHIHFIENPGMAFGLEFGGAYGKLFLNLFRIVAVIVLFVILKRAVLKGAYKGFIISLSLIIAGAMGNIFDSAFYGMIFSKSPPIFGHEEVCQGSATFLPAQGYAGFMEGKVVDMLHFPMIEGRFPEWFPFWAGEKFLFFRPVFNIADSSITIGIFWIILHQRKYLGDKGRTRTPEEDEEPPEEPSEHDPIQRDHQH